MHCNHLWLSGPFLQNLVCCGLCSQKLLLIKIALQTREQFLLATALRHSTPCTGCSQSVDWALLCNHNALNCQLLLSICICNCNWHKSLLRSQRENGFSRPIRTCIQSCLLVIAPVINAHNRLTIFLFHDTFTL